MKKTRSDAGKLGQQAAQETQQRMKRLRIEAYLLDPQKCACCQVSMPYEQRTNKYCNRSCAATHNNMGRNRNPSGGFVKAGAGGVLRGSPIPTVICACGASYRHRGDYCSITCCHSQKRDLRITQWQRGELVGHTGKTASLKRFIRQWLLAQADYACSICGWNKRHPIDGLPLVEVDHIDGDATNSIQSNLRVLCPNCHSETPSFRARNKTSTRNRK